MFSKTRCLVFMTMSFAIASSACSARLSEPAAPVGAAVPCLGGTLRSAADAARYAACDTVTGDLHITQSSLSSLEALSRLRQVSGTLEISGNSELDDLRGLSQLSRVGALEVHGNADLDSLVGLEGLHSAPTVSITDNAELGTLKGLEGLTQVQHLSIERNGIYDTRGLGNLSAVGTLVVKGNSKLISLRGFNGLKRARQIEIQNNPLLAAYYGLFPQLHSVEQTPLLSHNLGLSKSDVQKALEHIEHGAEEPRVAIHTSKRDASLR